MSSSYGTNKKATVLSGNKGSGKSSKNPNTNMPKSKKGMGKSKKKTGSGHSMDRSSMM